MPRQAENLVPYQILYRTDHSLEVAILNSYVSNLYKPALNYLPKQNIAHKYLHVVSSQYQNTQINENKALEQMSMIKFSFYGTLHLQLVLFEEIFI